MMSLVSTLNDSIGNQGVMMLLPKEIRTSGAYVLYKGSFVFQFGPTKKGDKLGVVRLGGHRENKEMALETAIRK